MKLRLFGQYKKKRSRPKKIGEKLSTTEITRGRLITSEFTTAIADKELAKKSMREKTPHIREPSIN